MSFYVTYVFAILGLLYIFNAHPPLPHPVIQFLVKAEPIAEPRPGAEGVGAERSAEVWIGGSSHTPCMTCSKVWTKTWEARVSLLVPRDYLNIMCEIHLLNCSRILPVHSHSHFNFLEIQVDLVKHSVWKCAHKM